MVGILDSEWGIIIILVVVVLVFGSSQLPKLARSLGSAQSEFKKGLSDGKKGDGSEAARGWTPCLPAARCDDLGTPLPFCRYKCPEPVPTLEPQASRWHIAG